MLKYRSDDKFPSDGAVNFAYDSRHDGDDVVIVPMILG